MELCRSNPCCSRRTCICKMKEWIFRVSSIKLHKCMLQSQWRNFTQTWNLRPLSLFGLSPTPKPQNYSCQRKPVLLALTLCSSLPSCPTVPHLRVSREKGPSTALATMRCWYFSKAKPCNLSQSLEHQRALSFLKLGVHYCFFPPDPRYPFPPLGVWEGVRRT